MKLSHAFGQLSRLLFTTVDEDEYATASVVGWHADPAPSPDPHLDWVRRVNASVVARSTPQEAEADEVSVGSEPERSEPETAAEPVAPGAVADELAGEKPWWRVEPASPQREERHVGVSEELVEVPIAEPLAAAVSDVDDAWWRAGATSPESEDAAEPLVEAHVPVEPLSDEPTVLELQAAESEPEPSEQRLGPFDDFGHLQIAAEIAESVNLGFHLGAAVEHIVLAARQGSDGAAALREAGWLIERYIALLERRPIGADLYDSATRLARTGEMSAELRGLAAVVDAELELPGGQDESGDAHSRRFSSER